MNVWKAGKKVLNVHTLATHSICDLLFLTTGKTSSLYRHPNPLVPLAKMRTTPTTLSTLCFLPLTIVAAVPLCPQTRLWQISNYVSFSAYNASTTPSYVTFSFTDASVPTQDTYPVSCTHDAAAGSTNPADANDFIACDDYDTSFKITDLYDGTLSIRHEFQCNTSGNVEDMYGGGSVDLQGLVDCDDENGANGGERCVADFDMTYDYSNAQ